MLANIPKDYWPLGPEEYWGDPDAMSATQEYLDNWENMKFIGHGLRYYSVRQGTGKTMLACIVAKTLLKRGEKVHYTSFKDTRSVYSLPYEVRQEQETILRHTPVLILDEVGLPQSDAQHAFFANELEDLIRARTAGSAVTIITTNLTNEQLNETYPRCFSLLEAKQKSIHVNGTDVRLSGDKQFIELEISTNGEARPIK